MVTLIIIAVTSIISYLAFNNRTLLEKLIFYPPAVANKGAYRLISYGFIHADFSHLIFNMLTLYFFGTVIEQVFQSVFGETYGALFYLLLYVSALVASIIPTWLLNRHNSHHRGLGASGAVSAIVFAYILINPMNFMGIMFIPIMLPAFLFGFIYIAISISLSKNHSGNINHLAHITGGAYGILFMLITFALTLRVNLIQHFFNSISIHSISDLTRIGY